MTGKREMRAAVAPSRGEQVFDGAVRRIANNKTVDLKALRCKRSLKNIKHRTRCRGDAGGRNQGLG